jgi:hypothetical protein
MPEVDAQDESDRHDTTEDRGSQQAPAQQHARESRSSHGRTQRPGNPAEESHARRLALPCASDRECHLSSESSYGCARADPVSAFGAMSSSGPNFRALPFRDRLRIVRALRTGRAVSEPRLAAYAVAQSRRYQVVPKRGSPAWFAGFFELGTLGLIPPLAALAFVSDRWGLLPGMAAAVAVLIPLAPVSRLIGAKRRRRASEAEIANAKLLRSE